ncbi:MAG: PDZ domain-containing protein [Acinetobacter sp.]
MKKKILTFSLLMASGFSTYADSYMYQYENKDGRTVITNKMSSDPNLTLSRVTKVKSSGDDDLGVRKDVSKPINKDTRLIIATSDGGFTDVPLISHPLSRDSRSSSGLSIEKAKNFTNVAKYYKATFEHKPDDLKYIEYLKPDEDVKIVELNPYESGNEALLEQDFIIIGVSEFSDWNLSKNNIIQQARKVGAKIVIVNKHSSSTVSYTRQDDPNNLDFIYDYEVTFFAKFKANSADRIGLRIDLIPIDYRSIYQRNTGVYVQGIIRDSKAYNANILAGDVIVSINGIGVFGIKDFNKVKNAELEKTKTLNLKILRIVKGDLKEIEIPISF